MKTKIISAAVVAVVGFAAWSYAQPGGIQIESPAFPPNPNVYRVRVVNEMGFPIRLKVIGFRHAAHFVANMNPNQSITQNFYGGERIVCAWDPSRRLELNVAVDFNRSGTLRLRPVDYGTVKAGPATNHAYEAIPRLRVQP